MLKLDIGDCLNQEDDIKLVKEFFFNKKTDHFKYRVLRFYRGLEEEIADLGNADLAIENYFKKIYLDKKSEIGSLVEKSRKIINDQAPACLTVLVKLMDYKSQKNETFIAIPTLLPFSPFNRPVFYFSITPSLFLNKENDILGIAIHEISHFLLFDILKDLGIKLDHNTKEKNFLHLFKETLTGMLLSEKELKETLGKKDYKGNPEVHNLYVKEYTSENEVTLREYLRENLHIYQQKGLPFSFFIKEMIEKLLPKANDFSDKKIFWNKNEQELRKDDQFLLKEYARPILI